MKIYVVGKYSDGDTLSEEERLANTNKAIRAGIVLTKWGHSPYVPHFTHYMAEQDFEPKLTYKDYMLLDLAWMEHCDGILILSGGNGVRIEQEWFEQRGKPVWHSLDEVHADPYRISKLR